jgi:hypothetical protein
MERVKCLVFPLICNIKELKGVYRRGIHGKPSTRITKLYFKIDMERSEIKLMEIATKFKAAILACDKNGG